MSIFGLPLIMFQSIGDDVGDLEYIEGKVVSGDYFQVSGDINNPGNKIEFIVPSGKTAFLIEAKITISTNINISSDLNTNITTNNQIIADLKIDNIQKSKAKIGISANVNISSAANAGGGAGVSMGSSSKFNVLGLSLIGDGVKKIEIENVLDSGGSAFAEMSGYLV